MIRETAIVQKLTADYTELALFLRNTVAIQELDMHMFELHNFLFGAKVCLELRPLG